MIRILLALLMLTAPVFAVEPDEVLSDPAMEQRARVISKELRCLVCRNENIDSSNAGIAKDLRVLVRERLVAGDSNEETISHIVDRYGEFVLLKPRMSLQNIIPWFAGPVLFLIGLFLSLKFIVKPRTAKNTAALSADEEKRLNELLGE